MDLKQLDALTRDLATASSRRDVARAVVGLFGLGLLGAEAAAGERKQKRRRERRRNKQDRRKQSQLRHEQCTDILTGYGCTYGPVGLTDAWSCPSTSYITLSLEKCNLAGAQMQGVRFFARFDDAILNNADFTDAIFELAFFARTSAVQTRFVRARMHNVDFTDFADTRGADFGSADLSGATFRRSNLRGAIFQQADLRDVRWCDRTICPDGGRFDSSDGCCGKLNGWHTPYCQPNPNPFC